MEQPNISYINQLSDGDKAFKQKLINIIKLEFPQEKETYYNHINAKHFKEAAEGVHKLKHKISILGLEKSYTVAIDYENNLIEKRTEGKDDFEIILQNITDFLKTL
ncbi:MAG: Hpt domain-containing protein [Winogradskyella sp.]